ncbi:DUF4168 domain-containing protein [Pseudochelatococcus sp. B33]
MIARNFLPASLTAVVLTAAFFTNPASAQEATQGEQMIQAQTEGSSPAAAISDQKIEAFAVAYLEVQKVRQDYSARIEATPDANAQQQLQAEAGQKAVQAVENSPNISVNEYNTILTAAEKDPVLLQKVNEKLQSAQPAQQ